MTMKREDRPNLPPRFDPSQMKTAAGREAAESLNARLTTVEARIHRLTEVLREFWLYTPEYQLDLVEVAIMWAFAAMASSDQQEECEDYFYSVVDSLYASTGDAAKTLDNDQRRHMHESAIELGEEHRAAFNAIVQSSVKALSKRGPENPCRMIAELLQSVRTSFMGHASPHHLRQLILRCVALCRAIGSYERGLQTREHVMEA